ncbi:hypothetical protein D3C79_879620 [compost metagenome]
MTIKNTFIEKNPYIIPPITGPPIAATDTDNWLNDMARCNRSGLTNVAIADENVTPEKAEHIAVKTVAT